MSEPSFWAAWQEPPRFLEPIEDVVLCSSLTAESVPVHKTLHPIVYGTVGALLGGGLVAFVAMHEMRMLIARAKALGFEAPAPLGIAGAPEESGVQGPATAPGKRLGRTG